MRARPASPEPEMTALVRRNPEGQEDDDLMGDPLETTHACAPPNKARLPWARLSACGLANAAEAVEVLCAAPRGPGAFAM